MKDTIRFWGDQSAIEVLRLSAEGIWANPDVPADDAAKLVLSAIEYNIKVLVQKAVEDEREACAKICLDILEDEDNGELDTRSVRIAAIRIKKLFGTKS
jgi:hypothetical protein